MKNKIKKDKLYFDLVRYTKDNVTGVLGLNLFFDKRTPNSFLSILKKNNLTIIIGILILIHLKKKKEN